MLVWVSWGSINNLFLSEALLKSLIKNPKPAFLYRSISTQQRHRCRVRLAHRRKTEQTDSRQPSNHKLQTDERCGRKSKEFKFGPTLLKLIQEEFYILILYPSFYNAASERFGASPPPTLRCHEWVNWHDNQTWVLSCLPSRLTSEGAENCSLKWACTAPYAGSVCSSAVNDTWFYIWMYLNDICLSFYLLIDKSIFSSSH